MSRQRPSKICAFRGHPWRPDAKGFRRCERCGRWHRSVRRLGEDRANR